MKTMNLLNIFLIFTTLFSCKNEVNSVTSTDLIKLPKNLKEISGMTYVDGKLWVIQDQGNKNKLYNLSADGKIIKTIVLKNLENNDWEALTSDSDGNIYVGDFGNNDNMRENLAIYKIKKDDLTKDEISDYETIQINYKDQVDFPPKKKNLLYDCESFFLKDGYFYLFTKNRSKNFDGTSHIYKVANKPGKQTLDLKGTFKTCGKFHECAITDAAISPSGNVVVLLSNRKLWIYNNFKDENFVKTSSKEIDFDTFTQREGVTFKDEKTLFISDEKTKKIGGTIYEYKLD